MKQHDRSNDKMQEFDQRIVYIVTDTNASNIIHTIISMVRLSVIIIIAFLKKNGVQSDQKKMVFRKELRSWGVLCNCEPSIIWAYGS